MKHLIISGILIVAASIAIIKVQSSFQPINNKQANMNYTLVTKPAFDFVGIQIRTDNTRCQQDMSALWQKFFVENIAEQIPHKIDTDVLAVYSDYEGDYTKPYSYTVGCRVSKVDTLPPFLISKKIPQAHYAVFAAKGIYPQIMGQVWGDIWKTDLKRTYQADFELYDSRFFESEKCDDVCPMGKEKEVSVFIGIE